MGYAEPTTGAHTSAVNSSGGPSPFTKVKNRVFAPDSPYTPNQIFVALALANKIFGPKGYVQTVKQIGQGKLSDSTVRRALKVLCDGPSPLFARVKAGPRTGFGRAYRFFVVDEPRSFAAARDRVRSERIAVAGAVVGRRRRLELEQQHERLRDEHAERKRALSVRVARGELTDEAYRVAQAKLENEYRRRALYAPSPTTETTTTTRPTLETRT